MVEKAVIYLRVSTDKQKTENQVEGCKKLCLNRGWNYEIVDEKGMSAYKDIERPKRKKVIDLARQGKIQHIVVWALDRWTRQGGITLLRELNLLSNFGCQLHSVQEGFIENFNMPGEIGVHLRNFVIGILGWQAKQESKLKSDRVRSSKKFQRAKKEKRVGRKQKKVDVDKIVEFKKSGLSFGQIAEKMDLPKSLVYRRFKKVCEN